MRQVSVILVPMPYFDEPHVAAILSTNNPKSVSLPGLDAFMMYEYHSAVCHICSETTMIHLLYVHRTYGKNVDRLRICQCYTEKK